MQRPPPRCSRVRSLIAEWAGGATLPAYRRRRRRCARLDRSQAPRFPLPAGASLAGAAIQTALLGRWAGSTTLAAYAAVNAVTRLATLLAFSFFVDAAAARLSRALGRRDAVTARSQVGAVVSRV